MKLSDLSLTELILLLQFNQQQKQEWVSLDKDVLMFYTRTCSIITDEINERNNLFFPQLNHLIS